MDIKLSRVLYPTSQHTIFTHYTRWLSYIKATSTYDSMVQAGTWTLPTMNKTDIISLFASSSSFYASVATPFKAISTNPAYSDIKDWLESGGTNLPSLQVWGIQQNSYSVKDLVSWIEMDGTLDPDQAKKQKKTSKFKNKSHKKASTSKNT